MAEDGRSAAIEIVGRREGESFDTSLLSQSLPLPVKPKSLARSAALDPPPLELPQSSPAECGLEVDQEVGRTLIRYTADISAAEFSCSPAERQTYLSQSCPTWGTQLSLVGADPHELAGLPEADEPPAPGAMAVPKGDRKSSFEAGDLISAEGIIAASPTIFESFKMYNPGHAVAAAEEEAAPLQGISEEDPPPQGDDDDDEAQFSLEA